MIVVYLLKWIPQILASRGIWLPRWAGAFESPVASVDDTVFSFFMGAENLLMIYLIVWYIILPSKSSFLSDKLLNRGVYDNFSNACHWILISQQYHTDTVSELVVHLSSKIWVSVNILHITYAALFTEPMLTKWTTVISTSHLDSCFGTKMKYLSVLSDLFLGWAEVIFFFFFNE